MKTFLKFLFAMIVLGLLIQYWLLILIVVGVVGVIMLIKNALSPKDTRHTEHQTEDWNDNRDNLDEAWDNPKETEEITKTQKVFYTSHLLMVEQVLESFELLTTTTNPETYFSRLAFMEGRIEELLNDPQTTYEENRLLQNVIEQKKYTFDDFLDRYAESTIEGAEKLKTEKGRDHRIESAISKLLEYREGENERNQAKIDATVERLKHRISTNESIEENNYFKSDGNQYKVYYRIECKNEKAERFKVNELEEKFFKEFHRKLSARMNLSIYLRRVEDGTLYVNYENSTIGGVKLQGRKYKMRILKLIPSERHYDFQVEMIEGDLTDFISRIDDWIIFINDSIAYEKKRNQLFGIE